MQSLYDLNFFLFLIYARKNNNKELCLCAFFYAANYFHGAFIYCCSPSLNIVHLFRCAFLLHIFLHSFSFRVIVILSCTNTHTQCHAANYTSVCFLCFNCFTHVLFLILSLLFYLSYVTCTCWVMYWKWVWCTLYLITHKNYLKDGIYVNHKLLNINWWWFYK
jgi:hypothetical protein